MVCNSCVEKIAKRLVSNHKMSWIEALERAHKGIERMNLRLGRGGATSIKGFHPLSKQRKLKIYRQFGFNPDYSWSCNPTGNCSCNDLALCSINVMCLDIGNCGCQCLDSPKPNSHLVGETCSYAIDWDCECIDENCVEGRTCDCVCNGLCYYDCDDGFEWDETLNKCRQKYSVTSHYSINNKGDTIEIIKGTAQKIVNSIRDRRLIYRNVNVIYIHWNFNADPDEFSVILTYKIPTT